MIWDWTGLSGYFPQQKNSYGWLIREYLWDVRRTVLAWNVDGMACGSLCLSEHK